MRASDNLPPLRDVISRYGLNAKKKLGQNFLTDLNLARRIARASGPLEETTIYEVGPGPGGLTRALLAEGAQHVVAVEYDARCLPALEEIGAAYPGRLSVVSADALSTNEVEILSARERQSAVRIAANLPYNVGTALLVKWLSSPVWPPFWSSLTLMFQREVAERIVAKPATKAYGRLSVLAQWRSQASILFNVARSAFVPPPSVTSAIVRIEPLSGPILTAFLSAIQGITSAKFGQRAKRLPQQLQGPDAHGEGLVRPATF